MDEIARLIEPQIPALRRYAFALLRQREAADDLVQDTLEHAIAGWSGRRGDGDLRAWLFTIERNLVLRMVQRRGRANQEVSSEALEHVSDPSVDPEAHLGVRDVLACVSSLPEEQRSVLLLVAVEDMTYAEAAAVLDIPVGTVMSRLSRARERMRAYVGTERTGFLRRVK